MNSFSKILGYFTFCVFVVRFRANEKMANRANLLTKMTCERQTKLKILSKNISAFTGMKRETREIFGEERNVILTSFIYRKLNTYIRELRGELEVFRNNPESGLFAVMVGWLHDRRLLKLPHSTTQTSN